MFLSALNSRLDEEGALIVEIEERRPQLVRVGAWTRGMPWCEGDGASWIPLARDPGILIVNKAHDSRTNLPVQRFLDPVPREITEGMVPFRYLQTTLLQLCARHRAARDLFRGNPVLLWLVAAACQRGDLDMAGLGDLLHLRQTLILSQLLDIDVRPAQVHFLAKLVPLSGQDEELHLIEGVLKDQDVALSFRHWPRVPTPLLRDAVLGLGVGEIAWVRSELAYEDNLWVLGQRLDELVHFLTDSGRLARRMPDAEDVLKRMRRTRSKAQLWALHDACVWRLAELGPEEQNGERGKLVEAFGPPPAPGTEMIQPIKTSLKLYEEGRTMGHCVATRADDVINGECYIYRVLAPQRATLQIGIGDHHLVIDEMRLAYNAEPSAECWRAIKLWLAEANRTFRRVGTGEHHTAQP